MSAMPVVRTQEEILIRIAQVEELGNDLFGVMHVDLCEALLPEYVIPFLKDPASADTWKPVDTYTSAVAYLPFAWSKCDGERGLSASRSVMHYEAWLWLLLDDETYQTFQDTEWGWYGDEKLKAAERLLGVPHRGGESND